MRSLNSLKIPRERNDTVQHQRRHFKQLDEGRIEAQVTSNYEGGEYATVYAEGNGRLNAVSNALKQQYNLQYDLVSYTEHALEQSSSAQAIPTSASKSRTESFPGAQA